MELDPGCIGLQTKKATYHEFGEHMDVINLLIFEVAASLGLCAEEGRKAADIFPWTGRQPLTITSCG